MSELVLIVCLAMSPHQCERRVAPVALSPLACTLGAARGVALWAADNPGWIVARFGCREMGGRDA